MELSNQSATEMRAANNGGKKKGRDEKHRVIDVTTIATQALIFFGSERFSKEHASHINKTHKMRDHVFVMINPVDCFSNEWHHLTKASAVSHKWCGSLCPV